MHTLQVQQFSEWISVVVPIGMVFANSVTIKLFEWIYGVNSFVPIDIYGQHLKEMLL